MLSGKSLGKKGSRVIFFATKAWNCSSHIERNSFMLAEKKPIPIAPKKRKNNAIFSFFEKKKIIDRININPLILRGNI